MQATTQIINPGSVNVAPPADSWLPYGSAGIGGSSGGGSSSGANNLSLNLGGFNVNYDLGPNTDDMANAAYTYLGNSFDSDKAFLGNTIVGSQNFLSAFAAPLENFNTNNLPSMFTSLENQNFALGSQAVAAESNVAQASVASSAASAQEANNSGGGFCFITTATCEVVGEQDNGPTLTALRGFRESFMQATPARRRLVSLYRLVAPRMLERLRARSDCREILERIFTVYIVPARDYITAGRNVEAMVTYIKMLADMRALLEV